ncbi:MAG: DNA adenine methylase [Myxococcales bacterium]|nr:DNA adenine methylase [Myxococcales bacterium]
MIKYIGSKRTLTSLLVSILEALPNFHSIIDLFSGTSRVGHAFKAAGYRVASNDLNAYAHSLATCYVQADRERVERDARRLIAEFSRLPGRDGYFTETFCRRSRFFQPHNGARVDAIREAIAARNLDPELEHVLLVSLMEAADRVDSTCGLQMAYVKSWAKRAYNNLELRLPEVLPALPQGRCEAHRLDARQAARELRADVAYLDPPYNSHSYLGNYHIWESLVLWDKPEVYGVACKRVDCRTRKSDFNQRRRHVEAFQETYRALDCPLVMVSFNNEGFQSRQQMQALLAERGPVFVISRDFKRYVGAQIGIHNPKGERVGEVTHLNNKEFIYLVPTEAGRRTVGLEARLRAIAERADEPKTPKAPQRRRAARAPVRDTDALRARILQALRRRGPQSMAELGRALQLSEYHLRLHLGALANAGAVRRDEAGRPRRYRLAEQIADG